MPSIRFTDSAEIDLLELWLTIAEENLVAADESLDSIHVSRPQIHFFRHAESVCKWTTKQDSHLF